MQANSPAKDVLKNALFSFLGVAVGVVLTASINVFWVNPAQIRQEVEATKKMEQEAIVEALCRRFDFIDLQSDYEDAIEKIASEYATLEKTANENSETIRTLEKQLSEQVEANGISSAVDRAKEYASESNYCMAMDALAGISSANSEVDSLLRSYQTLAAKQLWDKVNSLTTAGKYDEATRLVNEYSYPLPSEYDISSLKKDIADSKPMPISELVEIDGKGWSVNKGEPIDNFDVSHYSDYTTVIYNDSPYWAKNGENYVEYRSYGKYKKLSGLISPYKEIDEATVRIIFDEKTVKTYKINKKTDPIEFSLDISDVDYIRFEVDLLWSSGVILSDVQIQK